MGLLEYQLLSPEEEIEETFPYRRVWRALTLEMGLLLLAVGVIYVLIQAGILANRYTPTLSLAVAVLPIGLFYVISVRRERQAIQPRTKLLVILLLSIIATNGVAWPMIHSVLTPDRWLPEAGFFSRIIGYTLTLGILGETTKYLVVRYTVWPSQIRMLLDGIAYSVPAALGYALILNVQYIINEDPLLTSAIFRVIINVYLHIAAGAIMGYFLAELAINPNGPFYWFPMGLGLSAFLGSLYFVFRRVSISSGLSSRPLGGVLLGIAFAVLLLGILSFIIENAEERAAARQGVRRIR